MKVLVLAAGRSKRMQPIKDKNFLDFMGKPLLQHQLEALRASGFEEMVIVAGAHNIQQIKELVAKMRVNAQVTEQEDLEAGMCGAVLASKDQISDGPVLIFSSNDVVDNEAFALVRDASERDEAEAFILGKKVSQYFPGGYLETDEQGYIHNIIEKPGPGNEPSDLVNLVVHFYKDPSDLIEKLEQAESDNDDLYEVALAEMMKAGVKMKAIEYDGFWQPIKFPWHVKKVFAYYFEKAQKTVAESAEIAESAVLKGDVIIGENVKIFENAIINGPVYIGDGSVIANNALVRDSYIGENCVIGFSTEVARSYLLGEVWTHSNYLGDSVIGRNVSFGAGAVTGNLRLDEKNIQVDFDGNKVDTQTDKFGSIIGDNVRVGVNASLMPGVKIGRGSFVGAGIVVSRNIENNSFVRGQWELKISENKENPADLQREDLKNNL